MKKNVAWLMVFLFFTSLVLAGCGEEAVSGKINEELKVEETSLTVKGFEIYDRLVLVENGEEMDLTFEDGHKAITVDISMNIGDAEVDHTNFLIESETSEDITPYEALSSDVVYREDQNIIDFNNSSKGNIQGNIVFSFSEEEINNNINTLVVELEGAVFKVPLKLN
ncbi:hypothetical protein [Aquibacillus rhizosphaerae]|uniref:DUF4352 domain-containing protein n=1 Tax=Aquibacillus rhizosphaerae TaxID=3051431 RepID=A0ABT7L7L4_9BACI|nr:hypothetical protein [Aquibacillus sp. LR5S19]MDL4841853.1 hypothetical protein [Aquibacillus sp. LR5S19]